MDENTTLISTFSVDAVPISLRLYQLKSVSQVWRSVDQSGTEAL